LGLKVNEIVRIVFPDHCFHCLESGGHITIVFGDLAFMLGPERNTPVGILVRWKPIPINRVFPLAWPGWRQ
jgi:hypothetical protein